MSEHQDPASRDAASQDAASQDADSQDAASQDAASQDPVSQDPAPQDPTPPDIRVDEPAPPPKPTRTVGTRRVMRRKDPEGDAAKVAVLTGSVAAALLAGALLQARNRHYRDVEAEESVDADHDGIPDVYEEDEGPERVGPVQVDPENEVHGNEHR